MAAAARKRKTASRPWPPCASSAPPPPWCKAGTTRPTPPSRPKCPPRTAGAATKPPACKAGCSSYDPVATSSGATRPRPSSPPPACKRRSKPATRAGWDAAPCAPCARAPGPRSPSPPSTRWTSSARPRVTRTSSSRRCTPWASTTCPKTSATPLPARWAMRSLPVEWGAEVTVAALDAATDTQALRERAARTGYACQFQALRRKVPWRAVLLDDTGSPPAPPAHRPGAANRHRRRPPRPDQPTRRRRALHRPPGPHQGQVPLAGQPLCAPARQQRPQLLGARRAARRHGRRRPPVHPPHRARGAGGLSGQRHRPPGGHRQPLQRPG